MAAYIGRDPGSKNTHHSKNMPANKLASSVKHNFALIFRNSILSPNY